ncbi:hypothetical protein FHG87_019441 [Trinorchestia longiramus]|nr:hypothetical protein FHG87_019441 [Trinorchestia longiramus]
MVCKAKAEGDLRSFSKRTTYFKSQLPTSQWPPFLAAGPSSSQNTCGPPSTATTSGVCVTPGVSTSLSGVNTSVEESIHDVTNSSIGGGENNTTSDAATNGAASAFARVHLVTNTNSIDRKLYFKKKKKTPKTSRSLFPFSQNQNPQNNSYASNTTLQSCTLNTTLNNSNVTLNLTTNTTLYTIAAINNINIANSIFGGPTGALFVKSTRPKDIATLYERAGETPLHHMRAMGLRRRVVRAVALFCPASYRLLLLLWDDGVRSSRYYTCQPVIGDSLKRARYKKLNLDIETRRILDLQTVTCCLFCLLNPRPGVGKVVDIDPWGSRTEFKGSINLWGSEGGRLRIYMVEAGFSHGSEIITKQRNRLNLENRGDLRLKLTNFKPNINSLAAAHQAHPSH